MSTLRRCHRLLARRGVDDTSRLPDYPYRDDALLIWGAISQWVEDYVNHYYSSDAALQGDTELQNWVAELVAHDGGRLNNVGEANRINTRSQLVELVTLICFTASAQHAAVNYPQGADYDLYACNAVGGLFAVAGAAGRLQ